MMSADTRRALTWAGTRALRAVLIAAIAITVFVAYGLVNNAWYHVLAVRGGSMEPAITAGDLIVITRPPERIEVGQVLTLQVDGAIVTHRVVEVRDDGTFVTQGDANDARDDFSANDVHVVGEYRFSLPLLGMLIEPMVSGAWFTDGDSATGTAGSGAWPTLSALSVDGPSGRIVWNALPQPVPIDPSATPLASPRPANPNVADAASSSPSATESAQATASEAASPASGAIASPVPTPAASSVAASPSDEPQPTPEPSPSDEPPPSDEPSPSEETSATAEPAPSGEALPSDGP
jgi:signal peptidase I